jgi:hypothetical protein
MFQTVVLSHFTFCVMYAFLFLFFVCDIHETRDDTVR